MNRPYALVLAAALGALSCLAVAPADAQVTPPPPAVLGLIRPGDGADGALSEVLTSSIAVKLARLGLQPITEPATGIRALPEEDPAPLFTLARSVQADYVLAGVYSNTSDEIEIQLIWYNVTTQEAAAVTSERGRLGLSTDRVLSRALADILSSVGGDLVRSGAPLQLEGLGPAVETVSLQGLPTRSGNPRPSLPREPSGPGNPAVRPNVRPGEPAGRENPTAPGERARRKHAELSTSGSAFVATGQAADYFRIGYGSALHFDLLFGRGAGRLGLGLYAAVNYFQATGVATAADTMLIPLGADLRYSLDEGLPVGLFVYASGGAAMLVVRSEYWGNLSKPVPYALGGMGVNLPLAPFIGTALDVSYSVYFEGSMVIMAFSPSVSLYFRL
jgi:hypothetical protein